MMLKSISTLALAFAAPALAQPAAPAAAPVQAPAAKQDPLDKVVCRTEDTLGSRLKRHKVCATLREWKDQEDQNREALERSQRNTDIDNDPGG